MGEPWAENKHRMTLAAAAAAARQIINSRLDENEVSAEHYLGTKERKPGESMVYYTSTW